MTSRISILSRIMRFAHNSSARRRTEMSAPFRAGRQMLHKHTRRMLYATRVEKKTPRNSIRTDALPISLPSRLVSTVTCGLLLFASSSDSLFRRLVGRGELVNSQACRDRSNNNRQSTDPLLLLLLLLCIIPSLVKKGLEKLASTKIPRTTIHKP